MIYLDWAATTPPDPEVIANMADAALTFYGNPSSSYADGEMARNALKNARIRCATVLGCRHDQLTFTSGGTESNSIVLLSRLRVRSPGTILYSALEHPSVLEPIHELAANGWNIKEIPPESDGRISPARCADMLRKNPDTYLMAIMAVNNEMGAIQPLEQLTRVIREVGVNKRPIHLHSDMVQAVGKIPIQLNKLDVDTAAFGAHKFRGPRGVGLLYHKKSNMDVLLRGGGQERGMRPGTENVAGAIAMAEALERYGQPNPNTEANGKLLLKSLSAEHGSYIIPKCRDASLNKEEINHWVPGILALSFPPIPGEVLTRVLAESGYAVSNGSACHNNKRRKTSNSITALGVPKEVADGMIRISIGPSTTPSEIHDFIRVLHKHVATLSPMGRKNS